MPQLSPRAVIAAGLAGTMAIAIPAAIGSSNAQPANKAVAAASKVQALAADGTASILSATFKTSKPEDLLINVSAECSILTDVIIPGSSSSGASQTEEARGAVRIWLTLDGNIIPLQDTSQPPQSGGTAGDNTDKVTFCDRLNRRTVTDMESDGIDKSEDYLDTKDANAFNWVTLNAGSGDHEVDVWAEFTTTMTANSNADAYIGNRTLVIEPTKLANNAVIGSTGTN